MEAGKTGTVRMPRNFTAANEDELRESLDIIVLESVMDAIKKFRLKDGCKIYFAGPWFTEKGKLLYDACKSIDCSVNAKVKIFYPRNQVNNTPKDVFKNNVKHIKDCDLIVALVEEKDVGTAWEIGMAYALGKPVYLLGYDETTFLSHTNVMLAFTGKCLTLKEYGKFLTNNNPKFVNIKNVWEGIE